MTGKYVGRICGTPLVRPNMHDCPTGYYCQFRPNSPIDLSGECRKFFPLTP